MSLPLNQVILGDCGEVMAGWPGNSVDCVVTDPPYRIGFLGKSWDRALPPRRAFRQTLRVLKPGALAFVMSSPRQDVLWRMLAMLEAVGFELRQSFVSWIYKTGFPKAYDVAKGIEGREVLGTANWSEWSKLKGEELKDRIGYHKLQANQGYRPKDYTEKKRIGKVDFTSDLAKKWSGWKSIAGLKPALECILMVNKPLSEPTIVDNVLRWGTGAINIDATRIPFQSEVDREKAKTHDAPSGTFAGGEPGRGSDTSEYRLQKGRFPTNLLVSDGALNTGKITKGSPLHWNRGKADQFQGIFGRRRGQEEMQGYGDIGDQSRYFDLDAWAEHHGFLDVPKPSRAERDAGLNKRFIILDSFLIDEAKCKDGHIIRGAQLARLQVDTDSYPPKATGAYGTRTKNDYAWNMMLFGKSITEKYQKDFTYIIKTGTKSITTSKISNWLTFLLTNEYTADVKRLMGNGGNHVGSVGNSNQLLITTSERMASILGVKTVASETRLLINIREERQRNIHSTVKPVKLMAYLIELGCPKGGVVLDPFVGSGTTCIAAKKLRRRWIGIEIDPEYAEIARARIDIKGPLDRMFEAKENEK